jgi:CubicO group peptidase (beta-lactamase class C family)
MACSSRRRSSRSEACHALGSVSPPIRSAVASAAANSRTASSARLPAGTGTAAIRNITLIAIDDRWLDGEDLLQQRDGFGRIATRHCREAEADHRPSDTARTYLPDFRVADEAASARVTLRQCLNHSAGWLGDDYSDFGRGADALAKYVAGMAALPQLTPPGRVFAYNNAAINLTGRVIEVVTGRPYEVAVRELLLDPLGLSHTRFFTDQLAGYPIAGSHTVVGDQAVFSPELWYLPENAHPSGGLISSARDQLRYARFHLGDGRAPDGTPLLSPAALAAMRSNPGPAGTLVAEIDGYGVSLCLRRTAEGVHVVEHGGDWPGQHSGFLFVPERDFAMTLLTNSTGGRRLKLELFYDDWVLGHYAGLHNPPATPVRMLPARLMEYEGAYLGRNLQEPGEWEETVLSLRERWDVARPVRRSGDRAGVLSRRVRARRRRRTWAVGQLPRQLRARPRRPRRLAEYGRPAVRASGVTAATTTKVSVEEERNPSLNIVTVRPGAPDVRPRWVARLPSCWAQTPSSAASVRRGRQPCR